MLNGRYLLGGLSLAVLAASLAAASDARVQKVVVRGSGEATEVEIETSGGPISPAAQAITGPDRIVVDFPGALPSSELHPVQVNQGVLKSIRTGLFSSDPPTTRIVLDLTAARGYQVSTSQNAVVVNLGASGAAQQASAPVKAVSAVASSAGVSGPPVSGTGVSGPAVSSARVSSSRVQNAALVSGPPISSATILIERTPVMRSSTKPAVPLDATLVPGRLATVAGGSQANVTASNGAQQKVAPQTDMPSESQLLAMAAKAPTQSAGQPAVPQPSVNVSYQNGLLSIHADKASLSQVLFEVHMKTQADIAIPAGAEQEQVVANLGPAPAKDVLAALLNGSTYNFIFVGDERALERVIISRKDPNLF